MNNREIAEIFRSIADILEINTKNPFRIRAYRKAAQIIEDLSQSIKDIHTNGKLLNIPGIGEGIANKISELIQTGKLKEYEDIRKSVPSGLLEMLNISSVGPKTVALIYKKLGVTTIEELEKAIKVTDFFELAKLLIHDALNRNESCGAHFREESQTEGGEAKRDDKNFSYVAAWEFKGKENEPELHKEELKFENIEVKVRSYK